MPQGTVVAIKPMSFITQSTLRSASITGTSQDISSSTKGGETKEKGVLYLVGVFKENSHSSSRKKVENLVWFEGPEGAYERKDLVEFDVETKNPKSIDADEAVRVRKIGSEKHLLVGGSLLSIVALFASVLLLVAVTVENKR